MKRHAGVTAALVAFTAAAVTGLFVLGRYRPPAPINSHGAWFDSYFRLNLAVAGVIFLAAQLILAACIWRFRERGRRAAAFAGDWRLEAAWMTLTALLFLGAAAASSAPWLDLHRQARRQGGLEVELLGAQFAWSVRYPGPDGKFGRTAAGLINDAAGNPFGIDPQDRAGKDDIVSSALRIPAGRPVRLLLRSRDVIHSFFVRELRIKQDLVPGMVIALPIQADRPGEYEIACAELCGLGHHQMRSFLIVLPPEQFEAWLGSQAR